MAMSKEDQEFVSKVIGIRETLESETGSRVASYDEIRKYIDGEHWGAGRSPDLPEGNVQSTFNYMQLAVKIHASKLLGTNSAGDIHPDCPARDWEEIALDDGADLTTIEEDAIKQYQKQAEREAQNREALLRQVWEENNMSIVLTKLADNACGFGDGFLIGPTWDDETNSVRIDNIADPGKVYVLWSSDEYDDVEAVIIKKRFTKSYIEKTWKQELLDKKIVLGKGDTASQANLSDMPTATQIPMLDVYYYMDSTDYGVICENQLIDRTTHDYNFVPFEHFKYLDKVNRPFGKSIIWDGRSSQLDFNETLSNMLTIIKKLSGLKFKGINLPEGYENTIKGGRVQILPLKQTQNLKQDLEVLQTSVQIWPDDRVLDRVKTSLLEQVFLTPMDLGGPGTQTPSGYALEVRSQSSLARAKDGRKHLELTLKRLNANIFKLLELKVKGAKEIIKGDYSSRIIFPDVLPQSSTDIINQVNSRLISIDSAMKTIGVENPAKEMEQIKSEVSDKVLGPEISKNWQAHMQEEQMAAQTAAAAAGPQPGEAAGVTAPGADQAASGAPAQLAQENQGGGPMPMAMPGVTGGSAIQSPAGAINQATNQGR